MFSNSKDSHSRLLLTKAIKRITFSCYCFVFNHYVKTNIVTSLLDPMDINISPAVGRHPVAPIRHNFSWQQNLNFVAPTPGLNLKFNSPEKQKTMAFKIVRRVTLVFGICAYVIIIF